MPRTFAPNRGGSSRSWLSDELDLRAVFEDHVDELREYRNGFAWGLCPFHDDGNPSFCVNFDTGWYRCFSASCGVRGRGIVSFVSELLDVDYREVQQYLEATYG